MSEPGDSLRPPFCVTETIDGTGHKAWLIDGNNSEAEALDAQGFWAAIIGKSAIKAFKPPMSMDLQEFFGNRDSPDEIIVASPLHSTSKSTPIRILYASCMISDFAMNDGTRLFLPALNWNEPDSDALISIEQGDWATSVPHHDDETNNGFTVFRSVRARLPKGFLNSSISNLSKEQDDIMRSNLTRAEAPAD